MAEAIEHPKLPVADKQECLTNNLQWTVDGRLQQKWVTTFFDGKTAAKVEWRDVPIEVAAETEKPKGKK